MPLTDVAVRRAGPREKVYRLYDGRGLYLEVHPSGGRYWRWKYSIGPKGSKREKRLAIGVYPDVSLADARRVADKARTQLHEGIDPSTVKQALRSPEGATFADVASEWLELQAKGWSASYLENVTRRLNRDVLPFLGRHLVNQIKPIDVLAMLRKVEQRGVGETVRRVKEHVGQVIRYAIVTGRAEVDPTNALLGALAPVRVEHFAAPTDPAVVGDVLRRLWASKRSTPQVRAAMLLAPLLMVRPGELRAARWGDVDLVAARWSFVAPKTTTPHIVPLATQAIELLQDLREFRLPGDWVFPGGKDPAKPMSNAAVNVAMRRAGVAKDVLTGHGWRATARTLLAEQLGYAPEIIEHQLAHKVLGPLGRAYDRTTWLPQRTEMLQRWADYLDELRAG